MTLIQIILIVFFVFAASRVFARYRAGDVSLPAAMVWGVFWLISILVVVLPNTTFYLARLVGVGRGADVVVYMSIAILFFVLFKILIQLRKIEKNITILTRTQALGSAQKISSKEGEK